VRVLLVVGDCSLARGIFEAAQDDSVEVIGCAETVEEAASMVDFYKPDVVLLANREEPSWEEPAGFQLDVLKTSLQLASLVPNYDPARGEPDAN
jgi:hypothetical protein